MKATTCIHSTWTMGGQVQEHTFGPRVMLNGQEVEWILEQMPESPLRAHLLETLENAKAQAHGANLKIKSEASQWEIGRLDV
jgi:hypothetical protein